MTDNLLDEEELIGDDELDEDYEVDLSLLDDDETPTKKMKMMSSTIQSTKEVEKEPQKAIAFSSLEKIEQENMLENELLDYDDDDVEDGDDEKERRESKFASERTEKPTNIEAILPQQKTAVKTEGETATTTNSDSGRGRGGYRGRGRGNWRPRSGFRPQNNQFPGTVDNRPTFYQNGMPFYPPFPIMNPGLPGIVPQFAPNMPPPPFVQNDNWSKRVEAFMRQTVGNDLNNVGRSRSYSVSSSGSSCSTCSSGSRSSSRSRSPRRDRKPVNRRNDKRTRETAASKKSPVDDKKTAIECAEAIGLDEEYLKKVEEQKRLREEIQRKKAKRFTEENGEIKKPIEKEPRKREYDRSKRSPPRRTERSPNRREKSHRHRHHKKHHRRERASSLERLAEQALKAANAAINPLPAMVLPPLNIPPPPLPIRPIVPVVDVSKPPPIPQQQIRQTLPQVPALRTVSTTTMVAPNMPKIVTHEPPLDAKEKKLKAQLVVVVGKIGKLTNAFKRISLFATSVGDIKKVWQADSDSVSIIFKELKDAKTFMTQYHNQPISGVRLEVSLHKMYLNLDTIP